MYGDVLKRRSPDALCSFFIVMDRCRYLKSVSGFRYFFGIFIVGSVFSIGVSKYRDIGIGIFPCLHHSKSVCMV